MTERPLPPSAGPAPPDSSPSAASSTHNFTDHDEVGAAVAVWVDGDLVVNLWGGYADARHRRPLAGEHPGQRLLRDQRTDQHLPSPARRSRRDRPGRAGGAVLAGVRAGRQGGHHHRLGAGTPLGGDRTAAADALERDRRLGRGSASALAASEPWWEPGTAQGYHMVSFGFILGEVVRRVTGRTLGQYLRTEIAEPMGIDVHIGLPAAEHAPLRGDGQQTAHPRRAGRRRRPATAGVARASTRWPRCRSAMGFVPDDELGSNDLALWRRCEFPGTNGHVSALGLATFYNGLAQEKILSREHLEKVRVSQGGFDPDVVLGPRVADHGWGLGYMLNQRGVAGPERAQLRPWWLGRFLRVRRPRTPHRLRLRDELISTPPSATPTRAARHCLTRSTGSSACSDKDEFRPSPRARYCGAMNSALLILLLVVVGRDRPRDRRFLARLGQPQCRQPGRCQGRRPPGDRAPRRPGAQPDRHRRRLPAGDGRRLRAVHRGLVPDRPGDHRQAGHAGQGERPGGAVLRAGRPTGDGHGPWAGVGDDRRAEAQRAR